MAKIRKDFELKRYMNLEERGSGVNIDKSYFIGTLQLENQLPVPIPLNYIPSVLEDKEIIQEKLKSWSLIIFQEVKKTKVVYTENITLENYF